MILVCQLIKIDENGVCLLFAQNALNPRPIKYVSNLRRNKININVGTNYR